MWALLRRWLVPVGGMTVFGGIPSVAQVTYHVFTPVSVSQNANVTQPTDPGKTKITLVVRDSTVAYAVQALAHAARLKISFDNANPLFSKRVNVHIVDASIMDALAATLRGTGLVARLAPDGETIVVSPLTLGSAGDHGPLAGGMVVGRVMDSTTGAGLRGAQVKVEGLAKLSAVTADSGAFTLRDVPPGDQVLQVRLFGYRPVTRAVTVVDGERTTVRIAMVPVATVLSSVVTTATGVQRKVEVGNDITAINVDSVMRVAPVTSVTDLLETRVPGLTVQHSSGQPGDPSRIRIRGVSSITGNNDPIVIVDGVRVYASQSDPRNDNQAKSAYFSPAPNGSQVFPPAKYAAPSPIDQIDPGSIETIEVFKGPSASALYGSDAANGVIVITTKRGRAGPTHWNLALGDGVSWLPGNWPTHYFKFGHYKDYLTGTGLSILNGYCQWWDLTCAQDSLVPFQALNDSRFQPFAHGQNQTASLTVSGGVPTLQYSLSGTTTGDVGILKLPAYAQQQYEQSYGPVPGWMLRPDNYKTYGLSGQLTAQPTAQTRVTLQSSLFNSKQQQGSLQQAISQLEGLYINVINDTLQRSNAPGVAGTLPGMLPLIQNEVERATASALTTTNALTVSWQPRPWLPLTATGGLNTIQRTDESYIPYGINLRGSGFVPGVGDTTGRYGLGRGASEDRTLTVGTSVPSRWLTTAVGANFHSGSTNDFAAYTKRLAPGVTVPPVFLYPDTNTGPTQSTSRGSTYGWYVEPRLNFNSRFFVAPGFRLDGGSASGTHGGFSGTGLTGFPKIDFSWLAVDQNQPRGPLSLLRPRVAFGVAGTQPGPTEKLRLLQAGTAFQSVSATLPGAVAPALDISAVGNTALRPETSRELEGGVDAELWRNRLSMTWTQYNKTRHNAIISIPLAPSVGGSFGGGQFSQFVNVGEIRNTGTEMTLNAAVLESRALGWQVGTHLSTNNNRVVRLAQGFQPNRDLGIVPGYPLFSSWAKPIVAYIDINGNHRIDANEYQVADSAVYVGQAEPKYQMNLTSTLTLLNGRLSATATLAYQNGQLQNNVAALQSAGAALLPNTPGTSLGTLAAFAAAYCGMNGGTITGASGDVPCAATPIGLMQTVNTFRFNALSVNYTLPPTVAHWLRVPRASLALQGSNLALHTNYRGFDPNVNAFSTVSGGDQTADIGQLPQPRVWWLKLNLGN